MSFLTRLESVYNTLEKSKGSSSDSKLVLPNPDIEVTTTNTFWHNVKALLKRINRPPDHFIEFLGDQLGVDVTQKTSSLSKGLILKGKQSKKKVTPLIDKYVKDYVLCKNCNSYYTKIKKDKNIRKYVFTCKSCNASYTV